MNFLENFVLSCLIRRVEERARNSDLPGQSEAKGAPDILVEASNLRTGPDPRYRACSNIYSYVNIALIY